MATNLKFEILPLKEGRVTFKFLSAIILLISCYLSLVTSARAQLEIAETYDVKTQGAASGDIVSFGSDALVLTNREYDNKIFGVIDSNPLVAYRRQDNTGMPIIRSGQTLVNVT